MFVNALNRVCSIKTPIALVRLDDKGPGNILFFVSAIRGIEYYHLIILLSH